MLKIKDAFSSFSVDDIGKAKTFYGQTLKVPVLENDNMLTLDLDGAKVFIYPKGKDHMPASFTVLNFPVDDVEASVKDLKSVGVTFEHYDMADLKTDKDGIVRSDGKVGPEAIAWFKDPAGNILAILETK